MEQERSYELERRWLDKSIACFISIKKELLVDKIFYLYCFITTLVIYSFSLYLDFPINYSFTTYLETLGAGIYIVGVFWCIYYYFYLILVKEKKPTQRLIKKIKCIFIPISKLISVFSLLFAFNLIFSNHTFLKSLIPIINPFHWDLALSNADKLIHFGFYPWEITHTLLSSPWMSLFLNISYGIWFFFMWGFIVFFATYKKDILLRKQFMLTFSILWIVIGTFLATIFSSVGPCFLELAYGNNQYSPLMMRLETQSQYLIDINSIRLWALPTQDYLWSEYINKSNEIGSGISAMPSMHVSISVLMALTSYKLNKKLGVAFYAFAILIQIGSVHLGWHYAIDGYISTVVTIILWKIIGNLLNKEK